MNADGLAAVVNDDLCILNCEVTIATIAGSDLPMVERTGFKSSSGVGFVTINVIKAADGDPIASPTVAVKVKNSNGTTVTPESDGTYKLTAGVKYYYSVAKTSYTTVTGYYNAKAFDTTLTIALTLA